MAEDNTKTKKSNLSQYVENFFNMIELYDDKIAFYDNQDNLHYHDYKGILKAAIDVF